MVFTTDANPPPHGFRYHDSGPASMQGVFWTQQNSVSHSLGLGIPFLAHLIQQYIPASSLISFARTRHGEGVQTGVLQRDAHGNDYVMRVVGDHSWAFREVADNTYASGSDALYLMRLVEGTLEDPRKLKVLVSFKMWYDCLRLNLGRFLDGTCVCVCVRMDVSGVCRMMMMVCCCGALRRMYYILWRMLIAITGSFIHFFLCVSLPSVIPL